MFQNLKPILRAFPAAPALPAALAEDHAALTGELAAAEAAIAQAAPSAIRAEARQLAARLAAELRAVTRAFSGMVAGPSGEEPLAEAEHLAGRLRRSLARLAPLS